MGNCSTMSVVEDFFEKFEKGELREAERVVDVSDSDVSIAADNVGEVSLTIGDLISVEEAVSVLINTGSQEDPDYVNVDTDAAAGEIATGNVYASSDDVDDTNIDLDDNEVVVQFYLGDLTEATNESLVDFKVIARGY